MHGNKFVGVLSKVKQLRSAILAVVYVVLDQLPITFSNGSQTGARLSTENTVDDIAYRLFFAKQDRFHAQSFIRIGCPDTG